MEQMSVDPQLKVAVDYRDETLPFAVKEFEPLVFKDEGAYCCILGPDIKTGVFGCGATVREALLAWNEQLLYLVQHPRPDDPLSTYVIETLRISKNDVW